MTHALELKIDKTFIIRMPLNERLLKFCSMNWIETHTKTHSTQCKTLQMF